MPVISERQYLLTWFGKVRISVVKSSGSAEHRCRCSVWRLSVAYIGPKSRTERPRKTKIGTEVGHVTVRDSDICGTLVLVITDGRSLILYEIQTYKIARSVFIQVRESWKVREFYWSWNLREKPKFDR